jgi:hypothetical protein
MTDYRRPKSTSAVREPVQVYLDRPDQERLERLTSRLGSTKSDVLRRGLQALEHQLSDPGEHPALRVAGILRRAQAEAADAAREHDRVLVDAEVDSWSEDEVG